MLRFLLRFPAFPHKRTNRAVFKNAFLAFWAVLTALPSPKRNARRYMAHAEQPAWRVQEGTTKCTCVERQYGKGLSQQGRAAFLRRYPARLASCQHKELPDLRASLHRAARSAARSSCPLGVAAAARSVEVLEPPRGLHGFEEHEDLLVVLARIAVRAADARRRERDRRHRVDVAVR